jgi:hypothetical protein
VFWVPQTAKEDKVAELVNYARILCLNQTQWIRDENPLVVDNAPELKWAKGGRFPGVPSGADQIRVHHPHGFFQGEAAFLPQAQQAFDAVRQVAEQIICASTAELGWFWNQCKL